MALPSSGTLSILDIQGEFGGNPPHQMSEYYRGEESLVPDIPENNNVPTTGPIAISDFYNATQVVITLFNVVRSTTSSLACAETLTVQIYQQTTVFNLNNPIYSNSTGTIFASSGWYKADIGGSNFVREWTGTAWIGSSILCI